MKGLYRYLAPFAPDYSGAASVFFGMGGLTVICDPGGCSGNVCGYDEPRFYGGKGLLFSAAIRDLDTIFGRDDVLEKKIISALSATGVNFGALVGTPVVSVIGTDMKALGHILKKRTGIDIAVAETNGMDLYDKGEEKGYMGLISAFAQQQVDPDEKFILVLGALPMNMLSGVGLKEIEKNISCLNSEKLIFAGQPDSLEIFKKLRNITSCAVVAPAGLKAARYLQREYDIPYSVFFPDNAVFDGIADKLRDNIHKKCRILIIHQQIAGNALRKKLMAELAEYDAEMTVGTWFTLDSELAQPQDHHFDDEDNFIDIIDNYDIIIGDPFFKKALRTWNGEFIDLIHYGVSGDLYSWENKI